MIKTLASTSRIYIDRQNKTAHILIKPNHVTSNTRPQTTQSTTVQVPPPPSWSISELRLLSTGDTVDKLSPQELDTLARRCLIDVRRLSPERREQLRIDVAGVMRCASVLLDVNNATDMMGSDCEKKEEKLSDVDVYDAPRGLGKMPIRRDAPAADCSGSKGSMKFANDIVWEEAGESRAVLNSESVQSKLVKDGGDKYFSVVTKRE